MLRVTTPPGAAEIPALRTRQSKTFLMATPGKFRHVSDLAPLHWWDGAAYNDVDTAWQVNGARWEVRSASFRCDFDPATFILRFQSRTLGDLNLQLLTINGVAPLVVTPSVVDDTIQLQGIGAGVGLRIVANPDGPEIWRFLAGPGFPVLVWAVDESTTLGAIQTNLLTIEGYDNRGGLNAGRLSELTEQNKRRFVEMSIVKGAETVLSGRRTYTVTEQATGRTRWRDPVTRIPEWRAAAEFVFPCDLDVQVVETVNANLDDGHGYTAGAGEFWKDYAYLPMDITKAPAWRFVSVNIPQGVTIDNAVLRLNVITTGTATATMAGEAIDNCAQWSSGAANGPNRMTRTTANVPFSGFGSAGFINTTVTTIVQEIVNRAGWVSGNALRLGTNVPSAGTQVRWDNFNTTPANAGRLTTDYTSGVPPQMDVPLDAQQRML